MKVVIYRNPYAFTNNSGCEVYGPYESSADADKMMNRIVRGHMDDAFSYDGHSFAGFDVKLAVKNGETQEEAERKAKNIYAEIIELETEVPRDRYDRRKREEGL